MRVWSVANQKGGVGKTTTTVALGCLLADQGKRVLMLDLDPQGSLGSYFGHSPETAANSSFDWFTPTGKLTDAQLEGSIHGTDAPGLYLVPGTTALATLERNAVSQEGMGLAVSRALTRLWDRFDYVIIDTPPLTKYADGAVPAALGDGALVLGRLGHTKTSALRKALKVLQTAHAPVLGVVATCEPGHRRELSADRKHHGGAHAAAAPSAAAEDDADSRTARSQTSSHSSG